MNAIDTNVLAYTFDPDDPVKQARARQLVFELVSNRLDAVLLWQVAVDSLGFYGRLRARDD